MIVIVTIVISTELANERISMECVTPTETMTIPAQLGGGPYLCSSTPQSICRLYSLAHEAKKEVTAKELRHFN